MRTQPTFFWVFIVIFHVQTGDNDLLLLEYLQPDTCGDSNRLFGDSLLPHLFLCDGLPEHKSTLSSHSP